MRHRCKWVVLANWNGQFGYLSQTYSESSKIDREQVSTLFAKKPVGQFFLLTMFLNHFSNRGLISTFNFVERFSVLVEDEGWHALDSLLLSNLL